MKIKKGDIVLVNAVVYTKYKHVPTNTDYKNESIAHNPDIANIRWEHTKKKCENLPKRSMKRIPMKEPMLALVVGKSIRKTGFLQHGYGWDDPGCLWGEESHPVLMVTPMDNQRYLKPFACLEEDLEIEE